jgi:precorrin-6B methylase 1
LSWGDIPPSSFYSGVATKKLTVNNIQVNNHKQLFRVIATKNTCKDTSIVAMLTVNDTCITSTTDTLYIKVNTSSLSNPIFNTVKVYPNPSSTQVIIDNGNYSTMGSYAAKILNASGQQVFQSLINQQQFVIDANTMGGAGVYTLYITDANNKVVGVKKIVLQ